MSGGVLIGPIGTATLTIEASGQVAVPGIQSTTFRGGANAISAVDITFHSPVDPARASDLSHYLVKGQTSGRPISEFTISLSSVSYDQTTLTAHLVFSRPIAFSNFRNLQVTARGFGANGTDSVLTYAVLRGAAVRYVDGDGDRILLGVTGRGAKIVVLRRSDGGSASAWVEGSGRSVFGILIPRRGSNRKATIDRFLTNGARLRLSRSIAVSRIVVRD